MTRAFVALAPPDPQRAQLGAYLERCRAAAPDFRWVAPASVHLTLRFLGRVEAPALADLAGRLRTIRQAPFALRTTMTEISQAKSTKPSRMPLSPPIRRQASSAVISGVKVT